MQINSIQIIQAKSWNMNMPEPDFKITIIFLISGRGAKLFYTLIVDLIAKWSLFLLNQ